MKKILFWCLLLTTTVSTSLSAQNEAAATKFGDAIVKSYFDNNCRFVFQQLHTSIISIEGGQSIPISPEMEALFCEDSPLRTDIAVSYELYQQNYTPQVLNATQIEKEYPMWASHLKLQKGDFLYLGGRPNTAGIRLFKASDMARFLLRQVDGKWKIVAI